MTDAQRFNDLRAACFAYVSLILIHTGGALVGESPPTPEENEEMNLAIAAVAKAGHDVFEAARAKQN